MINSDVKAAEARRAYYKAWRAKNKEKIRETNLRYWARRAEREAAAQNEQEVKEDDK